eukprot:12438618-Ditylum_brightwellii.AAC.1
MDTSRHADDHGNYLAIPRKNENVRDKMVVLPTIVVPLLLVIIARHLESQLETIHGAIELVVTQ